ncbi:MAG: tetratricopeptide repeat protein [Treponema sp.]|nr:tetratricopeptide repeat protein [Treponema sp.]
MKNKLCICLFAAAAVFASAQTADPPVPALRTEHFEVSGDTGTEDRIAREMEYRFELYNQMFRFDPQTADLPLRVRVFGKQGDYDGYVISRLGEPRPGAVYLHYAGAGRRELVINSGSADEVRALSYQAFIQYLRAFIPNPPAWIREGFAVFFSTLAFDETGEPAYEENLAWLDTVKGMKDLPAPGAVMMADVLGMPNDFQGLAWSVVSFFLNYEKRDYLRTLTDSFMLLSGTQSAAENAEAVMKRIFLWNNMDDLTAGYLEYLASRKSFSELVAEGQQTYSQGKRDEAKRAFTAARDQNPSHYAPCYYLGLLAYDSGEHDAAEQHYRSALGLGADEALVLYALGLNAAAAGRYGEARDFLRQAAAAAPARYKQKAESLISLMPEKKQL